MSHHFDCGDCDKPLKLDTSLTRLNQSQLNLITNSLQNEEFIKNDNEQLQDLDPKDYITTDKLKLYNELPKNSKPIFYKSYFESEDEDSEEEENEDNDDNDLIGFKSNSNSDIDSYLVVNENESIKNDPNPSIDELQDYEIKISTRIKKLNKIFKILSNLQETQHPLSEDCANLLIENYKLKFDQSQKEKNQYLNFLKKLKIQDQKLNINDEKINELEIDKNLKNSISEYQNLKELESSKLKELKELEIKKSNLEIQLQKNEKELENINNNELSNLLRLRNEFQLNLSDKQTELNQLKASYQIHLDHLDQLRKTNIYKTMFNIKIDEKYGTINGYRIGYKIVWPEINAALGQIVILLTFITKRLNLKLKNYKLVPMGSQSQIIKFTNSTSESSSTKQKTILNLYSSDEFTLGRLFNFNKLDISLITLLEIILIIEKELIKLDNEIELPYKIFKDTIGGKSIRVTSNSEWTQSCKILLTNLNWILTFIEAHTE
ncbi:atg6 [Candida pseudojiufengensis]|uniref:atg6 n=1 Tax=Candida pseudojiufengensis TaxID=497109 RepID=UPI0022250F3D|nr:atg6 [Candida pseudojiufengensis]KAI5965691.1 atg6 [Candida pseudojiufengensis]